MGDRTLRSFIHKKGGGGAILPAIQVKDAYFTFEDAICKSTMEHWTAKTRSSFHLHDITGLIQNFNLNSRLWFSGPNLLKKGILGKEKKWTSPLSSTSLNYS